MLRNVLTGLERLPARSCGMSLPRYALPEAFIRLEKMPCAATVKIGRQKLRSMILSAVRAADPLHGVLPLLRCADPAGIVA